MQTAIGWVWAPIIQSKQNRKLHLSHVCFVSVSGYMWGSGLDCQSSLKCRTNFCTYFMHWKELLTPSFSSLLSPLACALSIFHMPGHFVISIFFINESWNTFSLFFTETVSERSQTTLHAAGMLCVSYTVSPRAQSGAGVYKRQVTENRLPQVNRPRWRLCKYVHPFQ